MDTATPESRTTRRLSRLGLWLRRFWAPVLLIFVSLGYSGAVTLLHTDALSPVDEWVYVDYLYKIPDQGAVFEGEIVGDEVLSLLSCEGTSPFGPIGPPCAEEFDDTSMFPNAGVTSAAPYTPLYFATTRLIGDAIHVVSGIGQLESWRLTGPLWLAASMLMLWMLMRQWAVKDPAIVVLGLAFIGSPFAFWTYTYVSTDAPSFFVGASLLYLAVRYTRGESSGWWIPLISTLTVLVKVTNVLALWLVGLYLIVVFLREVRSTTWTGFDSRRPNLPKRRSLALLGFPFLAALLAIAVQFAWLRLVSEMAVSSSRADQGVSSVLSSTELLSQFTNFLPGAINYSPISTFVPGFVYAPLSWMCVAGVVGAFWHFTSQRDERPIIISITLAAALFAPLLAVTLQIITGSYFQLPSRYGASLLPGFLLLCGLLLRSRSGHWVVGGYAVALLGVGVWLSGYLAEIA